jgi:hypothetical protein
MYDRIRHQNQEFYEHAWSFDTYGLRVQLSEGCFARNGIHRYLCARCGSDRLALCMWPYQA